MCMLVPREIAELRAVQINRGIDHKKFPNGVKLEQIAPHVLFHHEREALEERAPDEGVGLALRSMVPKEPDGKIRVIKLGKEGS